MKKLKEYLFIVLVSALVFLLGFNHNDSVKPNEYYQVYLDSELIGIIESKEKLENYISNHANEIRKNIKEYNLKIEAIDTFNKFVNRDDKS